MNKHARLLSTLLAVSSMVSMTPAFATDTRLKDYDGELYNAVAYKDGQFYIDGEADGKNEGVYYLSDGKYNELDDVDSGDELSLYGDKYVEINDGDYYVDLTSGKVTDDDIREDGLDDAQSALRKKVRKDTDDRYDEDTTSSDINLKLIDSNKFLEPYFEGDIKSAEVKPEKNGSAESYHIYTDGNGKYIDADYLIGKIQIKDTTGGSVTLKNTEDKDKDTRAVIRHEKTIASDKDYIYRLAKLQILYNGENVTANQKFGGKEIGVTTSSSVELKEIPVIQKISKSQSSDDVDGAKLPKSVATYFITDEDGKIDILYNNFTVVDGKLINYEYDSESIVAQTVELKTKNGYYYVDTDATDMDIDDDDNFAVDTDIDGNLWVLNGGRIYKWSKDDFTKELKVDGACTDFSIYDKNNIIAWAEDEDIYCMLGGKAISDTGKEEVTNTEKGWSTNEDGSVTYIKEDGTKAIGWLQDPSTQNWFYFDSNGVQQKNGWVQDGANWYFLNLDGSMATGWINDGGTWFYLNPISDGTRGAMKTGWIKDGATWYYLNPISDGHKGAMKTGWVQVGRVWYYLKPNGAMATGWVQVGSKWYFCNNSGAMLANTSINGYKLGSNGAWVK